MREMKESGIPWIGQIPASWDVIKIKNACWLKGRIGWDGLKSSEYIDDGPYLITGTDFINGHINWDSCVHISEKRFTQDEDIHIIEDDLLITKDGTVGKVAVVKDCPIKVSLNSGVLLVRNTKTIKYFQKYLYYVLVSPQFWIWYELSQSGNSTIKHLYQEQFYNFAFSFPPLSEQEKIASFLDKKCEIIDRVLEYNQASITQYRALKKTIITDAVTKGIRQTRESKFSGVEWIGIMPKDWTKRKLKSFSRIISKGATPKDISTEQDSTHQIRFLKSENIVANCLVSNPQFFIGKGTHLGELKRSQLSPNDILFVIAGASLGKVALMDETFLEANTNQAMSFIRVKDEYMQMRKYLWYSLQSNLVSTYIQLFSVQSAQPNISMEDLGNYFILYPNDPYELNEITAYLDQKCAEIDSLIASKEKFITELESYKKSLIYEYVTGKKEVL